MPDVLDRFMDEVLATATKHQEPATIVAVLVPKMAELLKHANAFLRPEHTRMCDERYARNAIRVVEDKSCSLLALCWKPGQWTPVHDHGTWGVVGIHQGSLEEFAFIRTDQRCDESSNIELVRGNCILLTPGSVSSFVPNPDHIHRTGVSSYREPAISLHLYGRDMDNFNIYDVEAGTRSHASVAYTQPSVE
ncbi:MAG: cysteine dioxygenase family protein [Planctomycetes bacterium]|nr:cysteine dioxygenase family protein [Planctomycetota bacterium]NUQ34068.1 cysteine dioxygenase family protein [Planctomycetaceae bacterium]